MRYIIYIYIYIYICALHNIYIYIDIHNITNTDILSPEIMALHRRAYMCAAGQWRDMQRCGAVWSRRVADKWGQH